MPTADLKKRMEGAIHSLDHNLKGLRTGRASVSLLDTISVDAYGSPMPLNQLASITAPEPRLLVVQVWDSENAAAVEKAISGADLGLNPIAEGQMIRVPTPELTEERRIELTKVASKYAEQAKVSVRNVRRDGMDDIKKQEKEGSVSKDAMHDLSEEIQKITDEFIETIDTMVQEKEKEIMEV